MKDRQVWPWVIRWHKASCKRPGWPALARSKRGRFECVFRQVGVVGLVVLLMGVTACAQVGRPPRCPGGGGLPCARVDQIETLVDQGEIDRDAMAQGKVPRGADLGENEAAARVPFSAFSSFSSVPPWASYRLRETFQDVSGMGEPRWVAPTSLKIWRAPYVDVQGTYHGASTIETVVHPGHWI